MDHQEIMLYLTQLRKYTGSSFWRGRLPDMAYGIISTNVMFRSAFQKRFVYFIHACVVCACMCVYLCVCVHHMHAGNHRGYWTSDSVELELYAVMNHLIWVMLGSDTGPYRSSNCYLSIQPPGLLFYVHFRCFCIFIFGIII